jgi:hypothetical protein
MRRLNVGSSFHSMIMKKAANAPPTKNSPYERFRIRATPYWRFSPRAISPYIPPRITPLRNTSNKIIPWPPDGRRD